jgi:hypothetical protein
MRTTAFKFDKLLELMERTNAVLLQKAAAAANRALVVRNWLLGVYIVEFEQHGEDRAGHGEQLLSSLSRSLGQGD